MIIVEKKRATGFSLIELLFVVTVLGILSVMALGKLFNPQDFAARGFFDDTVNATRFAQKLAISSGCAVQINITSAGYDIDQRAAGCSSGAYTAQVMNPANRSQPYQNFNKPAELNVDSPASIVFSARGDLTSAGDSIVAMSAGGLSFSFTVYQQTGLVNVN